MNPAAGGGDAADPVVEAFREAGGHRVRRTSGPGDARLFAREAGTGGESRVIVVGGDGTVREVVAGLMEAGCVDDITLGIVPTGTGNDLARSLRIPERPLEALELAMAPAGREGGRRLDLLRVRLDEGDAVWALNAVVVGRGGDVGDALAPEVKARWGPLSYLRGAAEVALDLRPIRMAVTVPGEGTREARVLNVVAANGRYAARGVPVAPGALPDDGLLDVVVVDDVPLTTLLGFLPSLVAGDQGEHPADPAWHHYRSRGLQVAALGDEAPLPVSVDGENAEARSVVVELVPGRLSVLAPSPS